MKLLLLALLGSVVTLDDQRHLTMEYDPVPPQQTAVVQVSVDLKIWKSGNRYTGFLQSAGRNRCWSLDNTSPQQFIRLTLDDDANMNGLPDSWEFTNGLSIQPGFDESEAINDGNGLTNRVNYEDGKTTLSALPDTPASLALPPRPGITEAIRADGTRVKLKFSPVTLIGSDRLHILRAKDDSQWEQVGELNDCVDWIDTNAPGGHDYRYSAVVSGYRLDSGYTDGRLVGDASSEATVEDVRVDHRVSVYYYPINNPPELPTGALTIDGWIPESGDNTDSYPPPHHWSGPLNDRDATYGDSITSYVGYLKKGREFNLYSSWSSSHMMDIVWVDMYPAANQPLQATWGTQTQTSDSCTYTIVQNKINTYDGQWRGSPHVGFDRYNNPPCLSIAAEGGTSEAWVSADRATSFVMQDNDMNLFAMTPTRTIARTSGIPVTFSTASSLASGSMLVKAPEVRTTLKLYATPRKNITVMVYRVVRCNSEGKRLDTRVPAVDFFALQEEFTRVFGQVHINVTVNNGGEVLWNPADDVNGDGRIDILSNDTIKFRDKQTTSGAHYAVFIVQPGAWGLYHSFTGSWIVGTGMGNGNASSGGTAIFDHKLAYVDVDGDYRAISHEIGHLMGLDHPFAHANIKTGNRIVPTLLRERLMGYDRGPNITHKELELVIETIP